MVHYKNYVSTLHFLSSSKNRASQSVSDKQCSQERCLGMPGWALPVTLCTRVLCSPSAIPITGAWPARQWLCFCHCGGKSHLFSSRPTAMEEHGVAGQPLPAHLFGPQSPSIGGAETFPRSGFNGAVAAACCLPASRPGFILFTGACSHVWFFRIPSFL